MRKYLRLLTFVLALPLLLVALPGVAQDGGQVGAQDGASQAGDGAEAVAQSSVDLLLDVIENDAARAELIERLRATGVTEDNVTPDEIVETLAQDEVPPEELSFGRRIALITQTVAEDIADQATRAWRQLTQAPRVFSGLDGSEAGVLWDALLDLALVIAATVVVYLLLRRSGKAIHARMGASARDGGAARTVALYVASAVIDALTVIIAWAAGYAIAVLAIGDFGSIGIRQTLYLNAFLLVEMAKVALRLVVSPSARNLRPLPIGDTAASYLSSRFGVIFGVVGYGQLLAVPILNTNVSYAAGRAVSTLIAFAVLFFLIYLVLRNRRVVADWMLGHYRTEIATQPLEPDAEEAGDDPVLDPEVAEIPAEIRAAEAAPRRRGPLHFMATHWHWPALAYLMVMFLLVLVQPGDAAFQTFLASGQVLVIGLLGLAVSGMITRAMIRGVILPEGVTARMPLLETRLNRFVPKALFLLRLVIVGLVVFFAMDAISLVDMRGWLVSQIGLRLTGMVLSVAMVLLVSFAIWLALTSWVDYRLNPEFGQVATARERTLLTLLRNAATIALVVITMMFVLAEVGLDIAPLLASAGVLGLAIGFGAQKMVQDIITGIFIQFENAMNVGDVVTVGGTTGTVERLTIRSVSLRDVSGVFHIIPFSSVDMVSNYMRDYGYFVCDMGVAYRENIDEVKQAMLDAFEELRADPDQGDAIIADLEWFGVNAFGDSAVVVRCRIKCIPGRQWGVGRAYNEVLKRVFDDRNIEIPFPHQTIYWGESKDGKTQSVHVEVDGKALPAGSDSEAVPGSLPETPPSDR